MAEGDNFELDRRTFLKSTGAAGGAAALANVGAADPEPDGCQTCTGRSTSEILVGITDTVSPADVEPDLPGEVSVKSRNDGLGYMVVEVPDSLGAYDRTRVQSQISTHSKVKYTEPQSWYYPTAVSSDVEGDADATPGGANDSLLSEQYAPQLVRADKAWEKTMGPKDKVTVAIVDQGVKYDHPDLKEQFGDNVGKDFVDDDDDPMPVNMQKEYHGTHVAGIAAGTTGNGKGIAGISNAKLISCRALGLRGGRTSDIADAVKWATDQGADIINMSLGGGGFSQTMKNAVQHAVQNGALPICATGNDCADSVSYPAKYSECVAVGAINENDELASFSNTGDVDVVGPGVDVLSCWTKVPKENKFNGKYNKISGTSMACPAVSGVAALGKAVQPDISPNALRQKLKETAVNIGLDRREQGAGRADAIGIVNGLSGGTGGAGPRAQMSVEPTDPHVGENVICTGIESTDSDGYIESWSWDFGDGTQAYGERAVHSYSSAGTHTIKLTVTDDSGNKRTARKTVNVQSGSCGGSPKTKEFSGKVGSGDERSTHKYSFKTDEPCKLTMNIEGNDKFTLYAYQRATDFLEIECQNQVVLRPRDLRNLDPSKDLLVGIYSGKGSSSPSGDYTVTVKERGFSSGGGNNQRPTASFSVGSSEVRPGQAVEFDASGSSDPDGSIESFEWTFGDGGTASGETTTHTFSSAGEYPVKLTVTDDSGASATTSKTVTVTADNTPPSAEVSTSHSTVAPETDVTFDGSESADPDGEIDSYEWRFGDGKTDRGEVVVHSYRYPGTYTATLTVTDDDGATAQSSVTITVEEGDGGGGDGGSCGDATNSRQETGTIEEQGDQVTYTYTAATSNPCKVTVNMEGETGTDFDLYLTYDGRTPTTQDFDARSWGYGSTEEIVVESENVSSSSELGIMVNGYSNSGEFDLSIEEVGKGAGGGKNQPPKASASVSSDTTSPGTPVKFDATSSSDPDGSIQSYEWEFGDGSTGSGERTAHEYDEAGEYTATLTVTDDGGATASDSVTVTVEKGKRNKPPRAAFTVSSQTVAVGSKVDFDASRTKDDGSIESYEWDFGDGSTATGKMVEHAFKKPGQFTVTLKVTDDAGATSEAQKRVTVQQGGSACGDRKNIDQAQDALKNAWDDQTFEYTAELDDPCQVSIKLRGPADADFDLYVTTDGRTPTSYDYDKRSATQNSREQVIVEDVEADQEFGILVDAWDGSGQYGMLVKELGKK